MRTALTAIGVILVALGLFLLGAVVLLVIDAGKLDLLMHGAFWVVVGSFFVGRARREPAQP